MSSARCEGCFLPGRLCLCEEIPRVATRTRILLVRHVREIWKRSNTARLAARALENSALLTYCDPEAPLDLEALAGPGTWLLFPDGPSAPADAPSPDRLLVLDGSWAQVRRMTQRIPALRTLPRLALPPPPRGALRLRKPSHPAGMSTLEAVAAALRRLEGPDAAAPLERLHALRVQRIAACGSL